MAERVGFFVPCLIDNFEPDVAIHAIEVLKFAGFAVVVPKNQTCCGQPWFNVGLPKLALPYIERFVNCFDGLELDAVVVPSGSCASFLAKHAPETAKRKPGLYRKMKELSAKIREFSDLAYGKLKGVPLALPRPTRVFYHNSCHMGRELGIIEPPLALIDQTGGVKREEIPLPLPCCGFGGAFSALLPFLSYRIGERKLEEIAKTGAEVVISADSGCLMHLSSIAKKRPNNVRFVHLASFLYEALPKP